MARRPDNTARRPDVITYLRIHLKYLVSCDYLFSFVQLKLAYCMLMWIKPIYSLSNEAHVLFVEDEFENSSFCRFDWHFVLRYFGPIHCSRKVSRVIVLAKSYLHFWIAIHAFDCHDNFWYFVPHSFGGKAIWNVKRWRIIYCATLLLIGRIKWKAYPQVYLQITVSSRLYASTKTHEATVPMESFRFMIILPNRKLAQLLPDVMEHLRACMRIFVTTNEFINKL